MRLCWSSLLWSVQLCLDEPLPRFPLPPQFGQASGAE